MPMKEYEYVSIDGINYFRENTENQNAKITTKNLTCHKIILIATENVIIARG